MKKTLLILMAVLGMALQAKADNVNIPDDNFKSILVSKYDTNNDGEISTDEAAAANGSLDFSFKHLTINSVEGIEAFTNITAFKCQGNDINGTLDLSKNVNITELNCNSDGGITKIILPETSTLTKIDCHSIQGLTGLDVSGLPNLQTLWCYNCINITSLDVTHNPKLKDFRCYNCGLSVINLLNNTLNFDTAKPVMYLGNQKASDGTTVQNVTVLGSTSKYNYYTKNLASNENNVSVTFKVINGTAVRYKKSGDTDWTYEDFTKESSITDGDYDSYEVIGYKNAGSFTLSYTRSFKAGIWQAWCVPFAVKLSAERGVNLKFAKIVGAAKGGDGTLQVYVEPITADGTTSLAANTPYVVMNTAASDFDRTFKVTYQPLVPNISLTPTVIGACTFTDNYSTKTSADGDDWYALAADESGFTHVTQSGLTLNPFRFYLTVNGGGSQAKIAVVEGTAPTNISAVKSNVKQDNAYYDLMGRRVQYPVKGIYIHQGKKIIVK